MLFTARLKGQNTNKSAFDNFLKEIRLLGKNEKGRKLESFIISKCADHIIGTQKYLCDQFRNHRMT